MTNTPNPGDQAVEAVARAIGKVLGLDIGEVCGLTEDAGECDSSTCPGALTEDHDAEDSVETLRRMAIAATAAINALQAHASPREWQDIATAPKDGTWFIAAQDGETFPCEWRTEEPDEGPPTSGWWDHFNQSFEEPTLWAQQPTPPARTALELG